MNEHHNIVIIGAGLSGLYCAWKLKKQNHDVIVLDARNRCGGRILSPVHNISENNKHSRYDMGPAWVWPELQPRLNNLITEFNINIFKQFTSGDMVYEKNLTERERFPGPSSHAESYRINGGAQQLIHQLQSRLGESNIHLNTLVQSIREDNLSINTIKDGQPHQYTADKIILALPPRLTEQNIKLTPPLAEDVIKTWQNTPTWMSGHCKIVFIYKPFWREQNLSGEAFSHYGPLTEIYDASSESEEFYALTSFVGLNAQQRKQIDNEQLINACLAQLQRLYGDESRNTVNIVVKDWSQETYTTTKLDLTLPMHHPQYPDDIPRSFWNKKLILAGTEVAREHGGYLEGALESADEAITLSK